MRVNTQLTTAAVVAGIALLGTACGGARPRPVPDVTGQRLNAAEDTLDGLGLHYRTAGGGMFGIVIRSKWTVCTQDPPPRRMATSVLLGVARSCVVPDVVGMSLDDAEETLDDGGIDVREHSLDEEPIVAESVWTVCRQAPRGGAPAQRVDLYVSHDCSWIGDW